MSHRYKALVAKTMQQEQALRCNNRNVSYIIMNHETRDFLYEHLTNELSYEFNGNCRMFGYKILIDEDLKDDEIKVVGDYRRWNG